MERSSVQIGQQTGCDVYLKDACVRVQVGIPPLAVDVPPVIVRMMWRSRTCWCSVEIKVWGGMHRPL